MFATIWTCTHEWSLIWSRATALTFETCHQRLDLRVGVDALEHPCEACGCRAPGRGCCIGCDRLGRREARLGDERRPAGSRRRSSDSGVVSAIS